MILPLTTVVGAVVFAWPFVSGTALPVPASVALMVAVPLALGTTELLGRRLDTRRLALLMAIAALNSILRAALVTGIWGFSPVFFLILCAGFAFGPSFGFLCGSVSLLASALLTGGAGPWLPYEMLAAGWVGAAAGVAGLHRRGRLDATRRDVVILAVVGLLTGFAYGALTDVYDWALYYRGVPDLGWLPGLGVATALQHFTRFYLATSLAWDSLRAAGNVVMLALAGLPVIAALRRLHGRFDVEIVEIEEASPALACS